MKFIWVSLIVSLINVSEAENILDIYLENRNINTDVSKISKLPIHILTKRQIIGLFPRLPNSRNKSMVNLKPPVKTYSQANQSELYKKPLMQKLSINNINDKNNDKLKAEVTTRRSLMPAMKFTVRPHDVYTESIREKYNWDNNRKMRTYKSRMPKSGSTIVKTNSKTIKNESTFLNINNDNTSLNDNDNNQSEKQYNKSSYVQSGSPKSKTTLLFPKRNYTKYFKGNPDERVSNRHPINNVVSKSEVPFTVVNNGIIVLIMEVPNMHQRDKNFVVNSNSTMKTDRQTELEKFTRPSMNKLLIKYINNKDNVTEEVTTSRPLTQKNNFTVRPHDVYANTINKIYNWNRNNSTSNLEKSKNETNITKEKFQPGSEHKSTEKEIQNLKRGDTSINNPDFIKKVHITNRTHTHDYVGLRKSKTLSLFPRRNNLKENTLQSDSKNKTSNTVNDQNSNVTIFEDKENTTITPEVNIKSDSKDQLEAMKEPKDNISNQEKKDRDEFIHIKEVKPNVVSNAKHDVSGNGTKTIGQRLRFYRFKKNKM